MNNSCMNSMIVRHDGINDKGIRNTLTLNSGDAIHDIPDKITIFASDLEDALTELSIHASLADKVNVHKLSRYIFPREDPGLTAAGKTEIPDLHCLEYAVNLACHKLNDDLKLHWDDVCTRDVSYPEVSKNGILTTHYDLKNQISLYNKGKEKERYVTSLANKADLETDILAAEVYPSRDLPSRRIDKQSSGSASIFGKNAPRTTQHSPLFVHPHSGPLVTFLKQCKDANVTLIEGFHNLIHARKEHTQKEFLLHILAQIKTGFVYKKGRKKILKFIKLIEEDKAITLTKMTFYIYYINKVILNVHKTREISILNFESDSCTNECVDKNKITGTCPEVYIKQFGSNKINCALIDTGAESNILSLEALEGMFSMSRADISPLNHQLALRGSTGLMTNAILGEVQIKLSLENTKMHKNLGVHRWSHCKVTFLVADPSVQLTKIILGAPFIERHRVSLCFSPRP